jgi:hypothetical protein
VSPQAFLVRRSPKEGVLRSIGEMPNGVIGLQIGEGEATWTVNFKRQPPEEHGTIEVNEVTPGEAETEADPLDVPKLVAGCEGQRELFSLAGIIISSTQAVIVRVAPDRDFPTIRAAVDLLEETLMAIEEAVRLRGGTDAH